MSRDFAGSVRDLFDRLPRAVAGVALFFTMVAGIANSASAQSKVGRADLPYLVQVAKDTDPQVALQHWGAARQVQFELRRSEISHLTQAFERERGALSDDERRVRFAAIQQKANRLEADIAIVRNRLASPVPPMSPEDRARNAIADYARNNGYGVIFYGPPPPGYYAQQPLSLNFVIAELLKGNQ